MRTTGHHRVTGSGEATGRETAPRSTSINQRGHAKTFSLSLSRSLAGVIERWVKKKTELSPLRRMHTLRDEHSVFSNLRQECLTFPVVRDIVIACNSRP